MANSEEFIIESGDGSRMIKGELITPEDTAKFFGGAVLMLHGWGSSRSSYSDIYGPAVADKTGVICLAIDLGGHGESPGTKEHFYAEDHIEDATRAYETLVSQVTVDENRIGVVGTSYGGYIAVRLAEEQPKIKQLLLRAPAFYPDDILGFTRENWDEAYIRTWRDDLDPTNMPDTHNLDSLDAFEGMTWLIVSENDDSIPRSVMDVYWGILSDNEPPNQRIFIANALHSLTGKQKLEFADICARWAEFL